MKLLKWRHLTTTTLKVITEVERGIKVNNKSRGQGGVVVRSNNQRNFMTFSLSVVENNYSLSDGAVIKIWITERVTVQ